MPEPNFDEYIIGCEMTEDKVKASTNDQHEDQISFVYKLATCLVILGGRLPKPCREDLLEVLLSQLKSWEVDKDGDSHKEGDG